MGFFSKIKQAFRAADDEVDESKLFFFHGKLRVHIIAAQDLPDTDTAFFNIDTKDVTDPYVTGELGYAALFRTRYIANDLNPVWDELFNEDVCHQATSLVISVKDKEHIGASHLATTIIEGDQLITGEPIEGWFDLLNGDKVMGKINLSVQYFPVECLGEDCREINMAYFPMRENNRLTLYQDADTPQLPQFYGVTYPDGSQYEVTRAWMDLFQTIKAAQRFIYITGWSVYTKINLVRGDDDPEGESNVGELLKAKAAEGVKVLMMVWDEKLSTQASPGLMGTHDEETWAYFNGSHVECVLVGRAKQEGVLASEFVGTCYTHHQKTVICDAPLEDGSDRLRIVAFIGGLDITDGRYDSCIFPLYSTIKTLHEGDFYNNCVIGTTAEVGPREPWHDCHAKVEGPAALDIMKNFEERW